MTKNKRYIVVALLLQTVLFAAVLSLSGQEASPKKPYNGTYLTVTSTTINKNDVRIIFAKNSQYVFQFSCNADAETCKAPLIGGQYQLFDDGTYQFKCDEYRMFRAAGDWCIACLTDVQQNSYGR